MRASPGLRRNGKNKRVKIKDKKWAKMKKNDEKWKKRNKKEFIKKKYISTFEE